MQTAFDHFNEYRRTLKMTTGSASLDSLIDSIHEGQFYLFYGGNKAILDGLVYGLLVNCVLPVREKHGLESMALYMNNVDYYQPDKSNVLSPHKIAIAAKVAGIEPKIVFKNLFIQIAYNQQHQLAVTKQISHFIENNQDIKLLVVHNLTKFFRESKNKNYAKHLKGSVRSDMQYLCTKQNCVDMYWRCKRNKQRCNSKTHWRNISKTCCKRDCTFERMPYSLSSGVQSHFDQT